MQKDQVDLENAVVWIPDSKTPNGVAEVPLTEIAIAAFRDQMQAAGKGPYLFPSEKNRNGAPDHVQDGVGGDASQGAGAVLSDYYLRSTYATRFSAGGVADEWVTQLLRQGDAKAFKKDPQMKLQMKREALQKLNRSANETGVLRQAGLLLGALRQFCDTGEAKAGVRRRRRWENGLELRDFDYGCGAAR